jgi:DHA1 family bicyclomycin/chloramphenicol resistance-like MFS transporter
MTQSKLSGPTIALLCLMSGFTPLITDGFLAAVRPIMLDFQVPLSAAQGTISVVLLGCACAQLFIGALADRYGRRPVLTASIVVFIAASIGVGLAPSLPALLVCRFVQGASAASGPILARAIVRDVYNRVDGARVLSVLAAGLALIPLLVPGINAYNVVRFGWRATAVLYVSVLLVALFMTRRYLRETLRPEDVTPFRISSVLSASREALANRRVLGYILCCVSGYGGLAVWISASPHLITGWFGTPPAQFGFYWALTILAYFSGGWASVRLLRRSTPDHLLLCGSTLLVAAAVVLTLAYHWLPHSLAAFLIGIGLYTFSWSMLQPNAQSGALAPFQASAGRVSALLGFLQMSGGACVAQLFGRLHDGTPRAAITLIGAAAVLNVTIRWLFCPIRSAHGSAAGE